MLNSSCTWLPHLQAQVCFPLCLPSVSLQLSLRSLVNLLLNHPVLKGASRSKRKLFCKGNVSVPSVYWVICVIDEPLPPVTTAALNALGAFSLLVCSRSYVWLFGWSALCIVSKNFIFFLPSNFTNSVSHCHLGCFLNEFYGQFDKNTPNTFVHNKTAL